MRFNRYCDENFIRQITPINMYDFVFVHSLFLSTDFHLYIVNERKRDTEIKSFLENDFPFSHEGIITVRLVLKKFTSNAIKRWETPTNIE